MIQNERFGTGLKQYLPYAKIIDQSKTSDQYFRLFDVPDKLYVGKNSFRIRINRDTLAKGSLLYIDIVDSTGDIIFHEITELVGEDGSRLIVVHVYEDTPPGEATIYIGGRASYDVKNQRQIPYSTDPASSTDYIDFPNLIWQGKVVVIPTAETENELIFAKAPTVRVKERFEEFRTYPPSESRKVIVTGSMKVSINPIVSAYEYSDSSKSGAKLSENSLQVILDPNIDAGKAESRQESIPQYSELPTLYDENGNFTEDFKGGEIIIRNLTHQLNLANEIVPDFSCSVVEVIDNKNVKIWPSFKHVYGSNNESVFKTITNATNVTASYYTTKTDLVTNDSESFMQIEFDNLEPLAGKVDSVSLSYKPFGTFGEFAPIGQFRIRPQEYLVDSSSLIISKTELIERPIGKPTGSADFDTYWELLDGKYTGGVSVEDDNFKNQGITIKAPTLVDPNKTYDFKLKVKNGYGIDTIPNTEFKLTFTLGLPFPNASIRPDGDLQLDVFISGSSIIRNNINNKDSVELISDLSEGERISSVNKKTAGSVDTYTYYFKTISGGKIYPVFVFKNASYINLKNISIQPRNEFGYSPNQARLFVPLETLKTNTELVLNVEYLTNTGQRSKVSSQVYGLFFSGSGITPTIMDNGLQSSPVFNLVSQSISVQTSGSSLYSTDPATTNFSPNGGIFLGASAGENSTGATFGIFQGYQAGYNAPQSEGSVFMGVQSGYKAANANNSIFIGQSSGYSASWADNANFIGSNSGYQANAAGKSNFIGHYAGYNSISASFANFIGAQSGYQASYAFYSNFIGYRAGYTASFAIYSNNIGYESGLAATSAQYSNFMGYRSGYSASSAHNSTFIGTSAGQSATNANNSNFIGNSAGTNASFASASNFIGQSAGVLAASASFSNFLGVQAGYIATNANDSNFLGNAAGQQATSASFSNFLGRRSGFSATNAVNSNFIGQSAGQDGTYAYESNFIGYSAGNSATNAYLSNFIGKDAGSAATNAGYSNFYGYNAGYQATNASHSVFAGVSSGYQAANAGYSILLGKNAGATLSAARSIGQHNIIIGNGISLPIASNYGLNIAGLIFGTGSYSETALNAFSGSANGKVGINQPNPAYSFDVSGSGNYTNNLYVTGGLLVTQSYISTVDYIDFTTIPDPPVFNTGRLHWTDDTKTLQLDTDISGFELEIGHQSIIRGRNTNSFTLTKGTVVYINGESGNRPTFASASWEGDPSSATTIGIIAQDITTNQTGYAVTNGLIREVNTNAFPPGTSLYLSSSGQYTDIPPFSPLHEVRLGKTITQATNGIIYIDIQNGYELGELHDVLITSASNGDLITWDSGSKVFQNTKILSGSYGVSGSLNISEGITGSIFGSSSYAVSASHAVNVAVEYSGSTIYSSKPGSLNFATQQGIFLGSAAGNNTSGIGQIFIGTGTGQNSATSSYAIGIGRNSAVNSVSASYSIIIGHATGRSGTTTTSIGRNNIIIGTGISVPEAYQDYINIGGLIFGSGSYFSPGPVTRFVSASNGKVGINQPNPLYSFDVSGSGNYTNGLTITGSVIGTSFTGSIFGSSSYASQALSSSYAITASYVLNSTSFPYTGSAQITGSLSVTGSINVATGSISLPIRVENTGSYYFTRDDYTVAIGGTTPTVYLPTITPGRICIVKNINKVDNVIVSASVSNVIDNAAGYTLTPSKSITVQGIDTTWYIIGTS